MSKTIQLVTEDDRYGHETKDIVIKDIVYVEKFIGPDNDYISNQDSLTLSLINGYKIDFKFKHNDKQLEKEYKRIMKAIEECEDD